MFVQDFVLNGEGYGEVGAMLQDARFDPGMLRPFIDRKGRRMVTVNTGHDYDDKTGEYKPKYENRLIGDLMSRGIHSPVFNATALRKEEWIRLDTIVLKAARQRLRCWADLAQSNTYGGFNGMSKMILEHETMSDPGEAVVDMDGLSEGRNDAPKFQLEGLPLPITHAGFNFSQRKLMQSRNGGTPLDTTMGEAAGRRVAELVEKTTIGTVTGITYGGASTQVGGYGRNSSVYGYLNFPSRLTYTSLATPTGSNPETIVANVLTCIDLLTANLFYGPFMVYHSNDWSRFMDNDYARLGGNNASMTLRDRLRKIDGIQDVRRLDYLESGSNPYTLLFVQMTQDVARAVVGMDMTTIQWESQGGLRLNFKVMCIHVPQLRADYNGKCGILQATTS